MGHRCAALILLVGCGAPTEEPKEPEAGCALACENLRARGCPEGEPASDGSTCEEVCETAESSGIVDIDTTCLAELEACGGYDVCTGQ